MGSFLLKEKNGVIWRGLKGSAIFYLGFFTSDAFLSPPFPKKMIKDIKEFLAETKSEIEVRRALLDKFKELEKEVDHAIQTLKLDLAKLEELRKPDRRYCESQEESVLRVPYKEETI